MLLAWAVNRLVERPLSVWLDGQLTGSARNLRVDPPDLLAARTGGLPIRPDGRPSRRPPGGSPHTRCRVPPIGARPSALGADVDGGRSGLQA